MMLSLSDVVVHLPGMKQPLFSLGRFEVKAGERVLIQGPSGQGKTTLLHLIAGLMAPLKGQVLVNELNLSRLAEPERCRFRKDNIGLIFQKLNLIAHLTAGENVALAARTANGKLIDASLQGVGMLNSRDVLAQNLSLGQQQRVAVARVLVAEPKLVLADEPTSSLDDENTETILAALFQLKKSTTILVVSHDHRIRSWFDRVVEFQELVGR